MPVPSSRARSQLRRVLAAALALAAIATLAACGGEEASGEGRLQVAATTAIVADVVAEVGGPDVEVTQIVPAGASPHSYAPSAREQAELGESELIVLVSLSLEEALPLEVGEQSFALAEHTGLSGERAEDPHVWLDPTLVAAALPELARTLGELDPANADAYSERARSYGRELRELDRELEAMVATVPESRRKLVTSHDAVGHFVDRYDFEFVGAPFGLSPESEAAAGELAELIDLVRSERVPAVFAQSGDDPEVLRQVAEEAGVAVVDDLLLEGFGGEVDSYPEMMRTSTEKIVAALRG